MSTIPNRIQLCNSATANIRPRLVTVKTALPGDRLSRFSLFVRRRPLLCNRSTWARIAMAALVVSGVNLLNGQTFLDPGFENYTVSPGGFVQPTSGPWLFANDAGVVEPFAPNSSTGPGNTWSATFSPMQGAQYASTYAAIDTLQQSVTFDAAGNYRLSVNAAAPDGSAARLRHGHVEPRRPRFPA